MADPVRILPNDLLTLKKAHPCGSNRFRAVRTGTDVRIVCTGCGRDMVLERPRLEKMIRKIETPQGN